MLKPIANDQLSSLFHNLSRHYTILCLDPQGVNTVCKRGHVSLNGGIVRGFSAQQFAVHVENLDFRIFPLLIAHFKFHIHDAASSAETITKPSPTLNT